MIAALAVQFRYGPAANTMKFAARTKGTIAITATTARLFAIQAACKKKRSDAPQAMNAKYQRIPARPYIATTISRIDRRTARSSRGSAQNLRHNISE